MSNLDRYIIHLRKCYRAARAARHWDAADRLSYEISDLMKVRISGDWNDNEYPACLR